MFLSLVSSSSLFLICLLFLLLHSPSVAVNEPSYHLCGNGNYTANSTYETNLKLLLPSLVPSAFLPVGFSNVTIGQFPNQIHGFTICRGDVSPSLCNLCLDAAFQDIVRLCPYSIEAFVNYDQCLLRYTNVLSPAIIKNTKEILKWSHDNITTDRPLFEKLRNDLLGAIADWAAYNTTTRFATGEAKFTTGLPTIYGLVQCSPDLWPGQCRQCLQDIFKWIPTKFQWAPAGWILQVSCFLRYDAYLFYDGASMIKLGSPTTAPATLVPPSVNPAREKSGKRSKITPC